MAVTIHNLDCLPELRKMPDKAFELAIVDPPYGIGMDGYSCERKSTVKWANPKTKKYTKKDWDKKPPLKEYFTELFRVSKNQIIWGANYFVKSLSPSGGWIFWDKKNEVMTYSKGELAFTSFGVGLKKFEWMWSGFYKEEYEKRIHPTQKPVALYEWLLKNYAKPGDRILDTHLGSGSIAIACYNLGFDLTGYEIDKEYFEAAKARLERHMKQGRLFETKSGRVVPTQAALI